MFELLIKKLRFWTVQKQQATMNPPHQAAPVPKVTAGLDDNLNAMKGILGDSSDVVIRNFTIGGRLELKAALIYIDGLVNSDVISREILEPFLYKMRWTQEEPPPISAEVLKETLLTVGEVSILKQMNEAVTACLNGDAVLLADGVDQLIEINCKGWEKRGINEPMSESVIRGPREGFTESLRTNTAMIRRKIKHPDLTFQALTIGRKTRTPVCVVYIRGVADDELVKTVNQRIAKMDIDGILESGYIEQYIEDAPFSIFSTVGYSEKPDVVAAKLLEGRVAIVVDGTPFVLTAPMLMIENFQSAEDYYSRMFSATMLRILRYLSFIVSVLAPAIYVALTTYHQELIPTDLLVTMVKAREGVPFPAVLEVALMMVAFEILREAGVRLPRPVGQAVSIVGALVIGEAAVSAGLISAPVVIVVAMTAVASFVNPNLNEPASALRFTNLILAGAMGGVGMVVGVLAIMVHVAALKSFGVPYLSPIAPLQASDLKDAVVRGPLWLMLSRPSSMARRDRQRQSLSMEQALTHRTDSITKD